MSSRKLGRFGLEWVVPEDGREGCYRSEPIKSSDVAELRELYRARRDELDIVTRRIVELEKVEDELNALRALQDPESIANAKRALGQALIAAEMEREVPKVFAGDGLAMLRKPSSDEYELPVCRNIGGWGDALCNHSCGRFPKSGACKRCGAT